MKTVDYIPVSKVQRASKIVQTGAKVGVNYVKFLKDKITTDEKQAKDNLNKANAEDIYDGLQSLKGSALKVAQMLSMEQSVLPEAYVEKFSLSQFSVPALSYPLVLKTFQREFKASPHDIFDSFSKDALFAASIGQVHKANKNGKTYAVKLQYPGVAESISSDLALIKPFALKMFNIDKKGSEKYFKEVEDKLLEETDYLLELRQSREISDACAHLENVVFSTYYPELSTSRILTMDWMEGIHLSEYIKSEQNQDKKNQVAQALWDLYMFQIHTLKKVHADPHPGNFLVNDNKLISLDFGCVKTIPDDFYVPYFLLAEKENLENDAFFVEKLFELEILKNTDSESERLFLTAFFKEILTLFTLPFNTPEFDFSDKGYFSKIVNLAQDLSKDPRIKEINANRGSKHFIYINRVFFGLYNLLHLLGADNIKTQKHLYRR